MQRVFASRSDSRRRSQRWIFGGAALFALAGLSYATGLTRTISGWFVREGFYLDPDSLPSQADPELAPELASPQAPITVEGFQLLGLEGEVPQAPVPHDE